MSGAPRYGIDLHTHSAASDGALRPCELVAAAAALGLEAMAVTDHDTLAGQAEAAAAAEAHGIEVIRGVEISVDSPLGKMDMLGLFIRPDAPGLAERLADLQQRRASRNDRMIAQLAALGLPIDMDTVRAEAGGGQIGRPHMAAALIRCGAARDVSDAFDRFLGPGCPAYLPKDKITAEEGAALIREAGGLPILAHPFSMKRSGAALLEALLTLKAQGVVGMECRYGRYRPGQCDELTALAAETGLLPSAGSDYHADLQPVSRLGETYGHERTNRRWLDALKETAGA